jgi:tetratricopeptide (TPR) repeat protein
LKTLLWYFRLILGIYIAALLIACSSISGAGSSSSAKVSQNSFAESDSVKTGSKKINLYPKGNPTHELVKQGVEYLREGNFDDAQKVFSAAVKLAPRSSSAHLLNGISYHLQYINGSPESKSLAETAYGIASSMDATDDLPLIQLGRLHIDSADYSKASKDFIAALAISPESDDGLTGLLQASLIQKDFKTALWAGDQLKIINRSEPDQLRLLALMYAATGNVKEANLYVERYSSVTKDPKLANHLRDQISYINRQLVSYKNLELDQVSNPQIIKVRDDFRSPAPRVDDDRSPAPRTDDYRAPVSRNAVTTPKATDNNPSPYTRRPSNPSSSSSVNTTPGIVGTNRFNSATPSTNASGKTAGSGTTASDIANEQAINSANSQNQNDTSSTNTSGTGSSSGSMPMGSSGGGDGSGGVGGGGGGGGGRYTATSTLPQASRWFDCDVKPGLGKAPGGGYGVPVGGTSGDNTLYLEPLPQPCKGGAMPKMTMIDAVIIRTVDTLSTSYGVNLLNGLQIFAGAQRSTYTGQTPVNASVIGVGATTSATLDGVSGLLNYSMNIANSTTQSNQVLARPTLTALDRVPSTFYSGQVQTVGLNGAGVSGAQVSNIPVGVSLSITPTFIDDENMMLAVKVHRSSIQGAQPIGGFNAGINTQQESVTANVKIKFGETLVLDGLVDSQLIATENGVPVLKDIPIIQYLFNNLSKVNTIQSVMVLITPRRLVSSETDMKTLEGKIMKDGKIDTNQLSIYQNIQMYQKMIDKMDSNLDRTMGALNRNGEYFREFRQAVLQDHDWVDQSRISRFFDSAINMLYFTR